MTALDDWARFTAHDSSDLVVAAFACPLCLRRASLVCLQHDAGLRSGICRCTACERKWTVAMRPDQFARVRSLSPSELVVLEAPIGTPIVDGLFPS